MRSVVLLALSAAVMAVDVQPGLSLGARSFSDLRVLLGTSPAITSEEAAGTTYASDPSAGPRLGLQWVYGAAGDELGAALGIEFVGEEHRGTVSSIGGTHVGSADVPCDLLAATVGLLPKLVLRPDYGDPLDWGPGSVQLEIGPVLAAGMGRAHINSTSPTETLAVLRWGARFEVVWTAASRWQGGVSLSWEAITASGRNDQASVSGEGVCGGILVGRRM